MPNPTDPLADAIAARLAEQMQPIDIDGLAERLAALVPSSPAPDRLWELADVATYLSLSPRTVRELAKDPAFPAASIISGSRRWDQSDIKLWVKKQKA